MHRRSFMLGLAASSSSLSIAAPAVADWRCTQYDWRGVQYCEAGVSIPRFTAQQRCQNWCWAACIEAVFRFHGYSVPQEEVVSRVYRDLGCRTATGPQIIGAITGQWIDSRGRRFAAYGEPILDLHHGIWNQFAAVSVARDLANNNPLINGAAGHATMITKMTYFRDVFGNGQPNSVTVRDPWPGNANRRLLTPQEAAGTFFIARVRVG